MPLDTALLVEYAGRTVWALAVVVVALILARAVRGTTMRVLARSRAQANVTILLGNLAQVAVIVVGVLGVTAIYTKDAFGWILTSFSIVGLVIGLSLQDIMKNFFSGIWVLVERPFRIGDTIEVGGDSGVVEEIAFRTTMLKTLDGRQVIVPNAIFMTSSVTNLTRFPTRRATVWIILADGEKPIGADEIRGALSEVKGVAVDPKPAVELRSVGGGRAQYAVTLWASDRDAATSAAISALRARFPQAEVHSA
ncbi:MAG TPA: mechanosensitive ion channel domain-containing protein [Candidatus Limnocylindria bacterium]|nr:mechanosensitive ion channel domain-containing protein [Candidatus Limnocylindria bacterium]